jgi:hypothetical protein
VASFQANSQSAVVAQRTSGRQVPAGMLWTKSRQGSSAGQVTSRHSGANVGTAPQVPAGEQRSQAAGPQALSQHRPTPSTSGAQNPDVHSASVPQSVPRTAAVVGAEAQPPASTHWGGAPWGGATGALGSIATGSADLWSRPSSTEASCASDELPAPAPAAGSSAPVPTCRSESSAMGGPKSRVPSHPATRNSTDRPRTRRRVLMREGCCQCEAPRVPPRSPNQSNLCPIQDPSLAHGKCRSLATLAKCPRLLKLLSLIGQSVALWVEY